MIQSLVLRKLYLLSEFLINKKTTNIFVWSYIAKKSSRE